MGIDFNCIIVSSAQSFPFLFPIVTSSVNKLPPNLGLSSAKITLAPFFAAAKALANPEEPEPTRLTTEIQRSDSIFVSDLQHENAVLGFRVRQNPNASTEDFLEPRARFSPLQLGSVRLGSASSGRMIIEKRPFSESEFDRFAKDNTGLLTNRYR